MPVYVYKNLTTGATFEVEQRITEAALTADPATGDPVKRVIQPVGIAFKGSGFYVTDSRGKNGASKPAGKTDVAKADAPPPPPAAASAPAAASGTD
jgi:predicted nucleic acid-binding Zn ribbon protein